MGGCQQVIFAVQRCNTQICAATKGMSVFWPFIKMEAPGKTISNSTYPSPALICCTEMLFFLKASLLKGIAKKQLKVNGDIWSKIRPGR